MGGGLEDVQVQTRRPSPEAAFVALHQDQLLEHYELFVELIGVTTNHYELLRINRI